MLIHTASTYLCLQLFLEEERELELERIYETGLVETLNRAEEQIGSKAPDADKEGLNNTSTAEATGVSKQTSETLTAGERIMEALDLADAERALFAAYEDSKAKLTNIEAKRVPAPTRNAILAALQMGPEEYVLDVVQKVNGTALMDALLVLPFGKVLSMMVYLNEWSKTVRICN